MNSTSHSIETTLPINTIPNSACPFIAVLASTTSTGTLRGDGKIAHG